MQFAPSERRWFEEWGRHVLLPVFGDDQTDAKGQKKKAVYSFMTDCVYGKGKNRSHLREKVDFDDFYDFTKQQIRHQFSLGGIRKVLKGSTLFTYTLRLCRMKVTDKKILLTIAVIPTEDTQDTQDLEDTQDMEDLEYKQDVETQGDFLDKMCDEESSVDSGGEKNNDSNSNNNINPQQTQNNNDSGEENNELTLHMSLSKSQSICAMDVQPPSEGSQEIEYMSDA